MEKKHVDADIKAKKDPETKAEPTVPALTSKDKLKKLLPKLACFVVIVGIAVACRNVNLTKLGHDFFITIFEKALGIDEQSEGYTLPTEDNTESPSDTDAPETTETPDPSESPEATETSRSHYVRFSFI